MAYTTIDDPTAHFQAKKYTGNGSSNHAITFDGNSDMQPDLLWVKNRDNTGPYSGMLFDSTRGVNQGLFSTDTNAQGNTAYGYLGAFQSDGFTVTSGSSGDERVNNNTDKYVMYGWKANGASTSTNDDGNIDTTVQVNTTAGFSIARWEGANSTATLGHGLGAVPELIISKCIDTTQEWGVYHKDVGNDDYLHLNENAVEQDNNAYWNDTTPTSSVWSVGNSGPTNDNGDTMIAYVFTPIQGYSKFGKYIGTGNADGIFVYLGFKPAFLMIKSITKASQSWHILTGKIAPVTNTNPLVNAHDADTSIAERGTFTTDFLSNGFKIRHTSGGTGTSGETYVYMAFAEQPFVSSKGVPCTAR